jgi:hypothetical protein
MPPKVKTNNRVVTEGEDGYFNGIIGLSAGLHLIAKRTFKQDDE